METYKDYDIDYSKYTILMVDDIEVNLTVLKAMLTPFKFNIITALSGQEALDIFQEKGDQIDIILLDKWMPDVDGMEVLTTLRAAGGKGNDVIILFVSAFTEQDEQDEAIAAGADDYITKPVSRDRLMSSISNFILKLENKRHNI